MTDFLDLTGEVALVTGGGGGLGVAIGGALAKAGASVVLVDINEPAVNVAREAIVAAGGKAESLIGDITAEEQVETVVGEVASRYGHIDILVNNAGKALRAPSVDLSLHAWEEVVRLNMTASFLCARTVARSMIHGEIPGRIVKMASIMGLSGGGLYPNISYQASKGAIVNLTRALAVEWAPYRIRVNAVAPTWVDTPLIAPLLADSRLAEKMKSVTPLGRIATPDDVASAVLFLADRKASAMITGHTLPVDGGFLAQ